MILQCIGNVVVSPTCSQSRRNSVQLRPEFDPQKFLYKVDENDAMGELIPGWKKLILARQIAEKEQAADDQRKKVALLFLIILSCIGS